MQTMRFLAFIPWEQNLDFASEWGERSASVGALALVACLAYQSNISVVRQGHMVTRYLQLASFPEMFGLSGIEGKAKGLCGVVWST